MEIQNPRSYPEHKSGVSFFDDHEVELEEEDDDLKQLAGHSKQNGFATSYNSIDPAYGSSMSRGELLSIETMNQRIKAMDYAVRGKIVQQAEQHVEALKRGEARPFTEVIFANIGNPQAIGQPYLLYMRQVLALVTCPWILKQPELRKGFPEDVISRAEEILNNSHGVGAYSTSKGLPIVRQHVCRFLKQRDGYAADPEHVFLTNGASDGVKLVLTLLIRSEQDGVLIPVPQYPLYSATLTLIGGEQVGYHLEEGNGWALNISELESALNLSESKGIKVRALVVINPGNPTGQLLSESNMREVVSLCERENMVLMADEVYQVNVYSETKKFVSFKKIVSDMRSTVKLVSFHSTSKGVMGECGFRGGYMELVNFEESVIDQIYKYCSVSLCPNVSGQVLCSLMVHPPQPGDASYESHRKEYNDIFQTLKRKAQKLSKALSEFEGITCNEVEGAMYAFPTIHMPIKAIIEARKRDMTPDTMYCLDLLNETGVCVVPGIGFKQYPGTFHFRTTFLPPEEQMDSLLDKLRSFHTKFMDKYS
eukprot:CAMPEP_0184695822 /NCGR_PEP_ID=MMETSP0313-20130426/3333_1 /TAXON_ID=2792 /ORGANISM="Porphyridium aerugineum, Strain SAG 1380-2" /LENGTH=536 /DNA_ID=CAMNT_0027154347 /DNA_START=246 /DNA_END=1856 /DNA_ORIENTATION=+